MARRSLSTHSERWTEREAREQLDAWLVSSRSLSEFAREVGVHRDRLEWWKRKLGYQAPSTGEASKLTRRSPETAVQRRANLQPAPFVEVKLDEAPRMTSNPPAPGTTSSGPGLSLQIRGGYRLRIPDGFDANTLHQVLTVIREVT